MKYIIKRVLLFGIKMELNRISPGTPFRQAIQTAHRLS